MGWSNTEGFLTPPRPVARWWWRGGAEHRSPGTWLCWASSIQEPCQSPRSRAANPSDTADVTHCNRFVLKKALCCSPKRGEEDKACVCIILKCYLALLFQVPQQHILRCVWKCLYCLLTACWWGGNIIQYTWEWHWLHTLNVKKSHDSAGRSTPVCKTVRGEKSCKAFNK